MNRRELEDALKHAKTAEDAIQRISPSDYWSEELQFANWHVGGLRGAIEASIVEASMNEIPFPDSGCDYSLEE